MASYSIAEARNQLSAVVHAAEVEGSVELTRRGKPVAVLLSLAEYERLRHKPSGLWDAICRFRAEHDLESDPLTDAEIASWRNYETPRPVEL